MVDDAASLASDVEMTSTREWCGDEYSSCLAIMIYRPLWYDTEGAVSALVVSEEIDECLMDCSYWWLDPSLRDREDTEMIFSSSESLGVEF